MCGGDGSGSSGGAGGIGGGINGSIGSSGAAAAAGGGGGGHDVRDNHRLLEGQKKTGGSGSSGFGGVDVGAGE